MKSGLATQNDTCLQPLTELGWLSNYTLFNCGNLKLL